MTKQTMAGTGMILGAIGLMLFNISDVVTDLQDWHGATSPAVVGPILKQIAAVLLGVTGGAMMPQPVKRQRRDWNGNDRRRRRGTLGLVVLFLLLPATAFAQEQPGVWAPEHRQIADYIGTWTTAGLAGADIARTVRAEDHSAAWKNFACRQGFGLGVPLLAKLFVHEDRPNHQNDDSFFSQHTSLAFAANVGKWYVGLPLAALVAYTRGAGNFHYWWPDVVTGIANGVAVRYVCP